MSETTVGKRKAAGPARGKRRETGLLNRELSWLDFDRRVLGVAEDESVALLERVKLCAIVSRNLDEFFAVRVAGLQHQAAARAGRSPDGRTPRETLSAIRQKVLALKGAQEALWLERL